MPGKEKILLVEDNLDNLLIYTTILEFRGYEVLVAKDGSSGLERARQDKPDLVLMDVSLPGIDGWTLTRMLKEDPATSDIPIIVLTAHALAKDRELAYGAGANGYISKPANPVAVADAVAKTLAEPSFTIGFEGKSARA